MADRVLSPAQVRRRRRPAFSCVQCRARKVRCDRDSPCSQCVKTKSIECTYASVSRVPHVGLHPQPPAPSIPASTPTSTAPSTRGPVPSVPISSGAAQTPDSSPSVSSLLQRIKQLESQLDAESRHSEPDSSRHGSVRAGEVDQPRKPCPVRGTHHKTRFFGQSHWMNGSELVRSLSRALTCY